MNLQQQLDDMRKQFEAGLPAETLAVMHKATEDLGNSGILDEVLQVGDTAPGFSLCDQNGNDLSSAELLARGPLVATFYRGVW